MHIFKRTGGRYHTSTTRKRVGLMLACQAAAAHSLARCACISSLRLLGKICTALEYTRDDPSRSRSSFFCPAIFLSASAHLLPFSFFCATACGLDFPPLRLQDGLCCSPPCPAIALRYSRVGVNHVTICRPGVHRRPRVGGHSCDQLHVLLANPVLWSATRRR